MKLLQKLKQILLIKLPNWVGIISYTILVVIILLLIVVLTLNYFFLEELIDLIVDHNINF